MVLLIIGLVLFLGIHSIRVVAPQWREQKIATMGENTWKGIYSASSIISFVALVYGYYLARQEADFIYAPLTDMYHPALLLLALSMILLMVFNLGQGYIKRKFRHPFLLSIILWSISHLWMNGDTASVILFGSLLAWSVIDLRSALSRPREDRPEPKLRNDIFAIVSGLAIFMLIWWKLHLWLIGVVPIV